MPQIIGKVNLNGAIDRVDQLPGDRADPATEGGFSLKEQREQEPGPGTEHSQGRCRGCGGKAVHIRRLSFPRLLRAPINETEPREGASNREQCRENIS